MNSNVVRISLNQICIGMISAESVYNSSGLLLLPKDTPITQVHLFRLKLYQVMNILVYNDDHLNISINNSQIHKNTFTNDANYIKFTEVYATELLNIKHQIEILFSGTDTSETLYECCNNILSTLQNPALLFDYLYSLQCTNDDDGLYMHLLNVALIANIFGSWIHMNDSELKELTLGGLLHDIGKLDIDKTLLNKRGKLTKEEFDQIKLHPLEGFMKFKEAPLSYPIKMVILQHHEKFNGSGYPFGFHHEQIHEYARIIGILDMYEAMTSDRTYRDRIPPFKVIEIFEREAYDVLDSNFLTIFLENISMLYIGKQVLLSNGETGKIIFINRKAPSQPLVQVNSHIYNLEFEPNLEIKDIV